MRDAARCLGRFGWDALRVSLSWKALVFASDAERRRHDEHTDDIDLAEVVRRFAADLARSRCRLRDARGPVARSGVDPDAARCVRPLPGGADGVSLAPAAREGSSHDA